MSEKRLERLDEIEIRIGLAEDYLDELNRAVFRQQQTLDRLQEQLRFLYHKMDAAADGSAARREPRDERPPHY